MFGSRPTEKILCYHF
uniref:Uncharacterized protein n=1 Tax=Arundo donax TaxID=35708 RepID=A0A0A9H8F0_ARUDO